MAVRPIALARAFFIELQGLVQQGPARGFRGLQNPTLIYMQKHAWGDSLAAWGVIFATISIQFLEPSVIIISLCHKKSLGSQAQF